MAEDQDYSQLSNLEKIAHKVWKVRVEGYNALSEEFANSRNTSDPCFSILESRSDTLKLLATDANVVAHEQALQLICDYLKYGATALKIPPMANSGLISALCEKGLSSARAGSKSRATEALLLMVEVSGNADLVVEHMVPHLDARLPKLVAGTASALAQVVDEYGCSEVVSPKPIIAILPKLFGHADRNVRAAATSLAVALYKWLGDGLTTLLFEHLKPVQQRDLKAEFEKVQGQSPVQKRFTAAQQAARASASSEDVEMTENSPEPSAAAPSAAFDPFSVMEPQDVLSKLPHDLETQLLSAKWKDRKEALDEVYAVLSKAPRIAVVDYTHLVRLLARCMKDANIQVVQLAANSLEYLSRGLQKDFHRYQHMVVAPMIERSKEKKPSVAEALANALDLIFKYSSLGDILDDTLNGMRHKTPQVKISAINYLQRCLANTPTAPLSAQVDAIMEVGVKLLGESQEPIRQAATEVIGTLMKITGERELKLFLNAVDDNRLAKVKTAFVNAEVKANSGAALSARSAPVLAPSTSLSKPTTAIPSKRLATSPAKRAIGSKATPPVRNLTGRLLISSARSESALPSSAAPQSRNKEIEALLSENAKLQQATRKFKEDLDTSSRENSALKLELATLRDQLELVQKTQSSATLLVKQKDMQISRLNSDLENAKVRIKSLEQSIEMMRLKQSTQADRLLQPYSVDPERRSPFRSPSRFTLSRTSQSELNSGVHRLSIDGAPGPSPEKSSVNSTERIVSDRTNVFRENASEEENWRKAAEVTANLKARIEKMKQRNRMALGS